jgi:hypothetical protein
MALGINTGREKTVPGRPRTGSGLAEPNAAQNPSQGTGESEPTWLAKTAASDP